MGPPRVQQKKKNEPNETDSVSYVTVTTTTTVGSSRKSVITFQWYRRGLIETSRSFYLGHANVQGTGWWVSGVCNARILNLTSGANNSHKRKRVRTGQSIKYNKLKKKLYILLHSRTVSYCTGFRRKRSSVNLLHGLYSRLHGSKENILKFLKTNSTYVVHAYNYVECRRARERVSRRQLLMYINKTIKPLIKCTCILAMIKLIIQILSVKPL